MTIGSMRLHDTPTGYGWISIALHWVTAVWVVALLYFGSSIDGLEGTERSIAVVRHTSLAILGYVILALRIVWRLRFGHPGPNEAQRGFAYQLGKWTHMVIVIALALMLVSGPLMAWFGGREIAVYDWLAIPSPFPQSYAVSDAFHALHTACAVAILVGILLHLGGVYKHTAFNQDGTLTKMIIADRPADD